MSKADKMFEKLGYRTYEGTCFWNRFGSHIYFIKSMKSIDVSGRGTGKWIANRNKILTMKQLQAINEKVKELGWDKE